MNLTLSRSVLRSWRLADAESLTHHANNRNVWINLRDAFPHPYAREDAERFLADALARIPETRFAIEVEGRAVGSIGFTIGTDVERLSAEIGYFLGEAFWGRGIMSEAVAAVTGHALREHKLNRVFAVPYAWNPASCRVLEKAGYTLEGRMHGSAIKDGKVVDQLLYAFVRP